MTDPRASRQTFNVGSDCNMSVKDIISRVVSLLDITVEIHQGPMRVGETENFTPDLDKLEKTLGLRPATPFEVGLQKTLEWYRGARC